MISRIRLPKQIDKIKTRKMAERLRFCRILAGKTLREFASASDLSYSTLSRYERALSTVSKKNMDRIVNLFLSHDIIFTRKWLIEGIGDLPVLKEKIKEQEPQQIQELTQELESQQIEPESFKVVSTPLSLKDRMNKAFLTYKEMNFFEQNIPRSIIRYIEDDSMAPVFKQGEYVVGAEIGVEDMEKINGEYCIVLLENDKMVIRQFFTKKGLTSLISVNVKNYPEPIHIQGYPKIVAPILYHRKFINFS